MATEAQKKARDKWKAKNKEKNALINKRSTARSFIRKFASLEDLEEIKGLIKARETELKNEKNLWILLILYPKGYIIIYVRSWKP